MQWESDAAKILIIIGVLLIVLILIVWWNKGRKSTKNPSNLSNLGRKVDPSTSLNQGYPDGLTLAACSQQFGSPVDCMRLQSTEKSTDYPGFGENNFDVVVCSENSVSIDDTQMTSVYMVRNQLKLNCFASSVVFTYSTTKLHNAIYAFKGANNAWSSVLAGVALITVNGDQRVYTYKSKYDAASDTLTLFLEDGEGEVITLKGSIVVTLILTDCVGNVTPGMGVPDFNMITGGTNTMSR